MNTLKIEIPDIGTVRTITIDKEIYYMGKDVIDIYEIKDKHNVIKRNCNDNEIKLIEYPFETGFKKDGSTSIQNIKTVFINSEAMLKIYNKSLSVNKEFIKNTLLKNNKDVSLIEKYAEKYDDIKYENFIHPLFKNITIALTENKEYFPATLCAKTLGYSNPEEAIRNHCLPEGCVILSLLGEGGIQKVKYITEGNLYRLIVKSKLPLAKKFEKWIFDEVIPQIRKKGYYINSQYVNNTKEQEIININAKTAHINAITNQGKILLEIAQHINNEKMKNTLLIKSANITAGEKILQLEQITEKTYTAEEISKKLYDKYSINITKIMIGRISNQYNLKTEENGYFAFDVSKSSIKQVESFRYYEKIVDILYNIIKSDIKLKNKYL